MLKEAPSQASAQPAEHAVLAQLERVLASRAFRSSPRLSKLLRYTVETALQGNLAALKEYVLGIEVFDRPPTFDPRLDSIVRVEARRLRAKLENYRTCEGRWDPVVIWFQRGDYCPKFTLQSEFAPADASAGQRHEADIAREQHALAVEMAGLISWEWEVPNGRTSWPAGFVNPMRPHLATARVSPAEFWMRVHPDDRERVAENIEAAVAASTDFEIHHRYRVGDDFLAMVSKGQVFPGHAPRVAGLTMQTAVSPRRISVASCALT
jgi:hypothetical protein